MLTAIIAFGFGNCSRVILLRPTRCVFADSSLNNEIDEEERAVTGELEKTDTQHAQLLLAVEERPHVVSYGEGTVPCNILGWGSNKCPRKTIGSFGGEALSLQNGEDKAIGSAYLVDELQGWEPRIGVFPTTPIFSLSDGDSVVSFLYGRRVTGLEQRLFHYLAWLRQTLTTREIMALAHLTPDRQYADPLTKRTGTNPELLSGLVLCGEIDLRSKKQNWNRIASGRERLMWVPQLRTLLPDQPERLSLLLAKGIRRGGALWTDESEVSTRFNDTEAT